MSGNGLGEWWDPDTDAPAEGAEHREVRRVPATGARPPGGAAVTGPGRGNSARLSAAVEAMSYETRPSRWWSVGVIVAGVAVLAAALTAAAQLDLAWAVVAVTAMLPTALLIRAEGRQPRRVLASADGLEVSGRRHAQQLTWDQVDLTRRRDLVGFSDVDTYLERADGALVRLPRGTPGGVVEAWRERVDGARPGPRLPQAWHPAPEADVTGPVQVMNLVNLVALLAGQVLLHLVDLDARYLLAVYLVVACAVFTLLPRLSRPLVTADHDGLTIRAWRRKHIPWSQVTDVRRKGRYDPEVVVELASGEQHELPGPDEDVVRGWWRLAVPEAQAPDT